MTELTLAWSVYAGAVIVLLVLWYLPIRKIKPVALALLVYSLIAALLLTPAVIDIEGYQRFWAPAFITAMMELMSGESALAISRLWSLTAMTLLLWLLALLFRSAKARMGAKKQPESAQENNKAG